MNNSQKMFWKAILILFLFSFLAQGWSSPLAEKTFVKDSHSSSKPWEAYIEHISLDLSVDFKKKILSGKATLTINNIKSVNNLYLDSWDLKIERITLGKAEKETTYIIGEFVEFHGSPLVVDITPQTTIVNIYYSTSPDAKAIDWVAPLQTAGGVHPFMYTLSQTILARTWIPLQDTPGVRFSYDATIKVPSEFLAIMSAENPTEKNAEGIYHFEMPQKIPSYLMALGVGDLEFRSLGPRTGVYAEPSLIQAAKYEFEDTEAMMSSAEKLYGPYLWGRYDLLILPPSFPAAGMENPRLSFVTPYLLAGDKSLVSTVAHELAHSWSGNLVTNASWDDLWLNEGFTTYFTGRIMEEVYGIDYENMLEINGEIRLKEWVSKTSKSDSAKTRLKRDMKGKDPDDVFSIVPYQKGRFFLMTIERVVGRGKWDSFLRGYFKKHEFGNMTTERFLQYLDEQLIMGDPKLREEIQIDNWVYGTGIPSNFPQLHSKEFEMIDTVLNNWVKHSSVYEFPTKGWTTHHWIYFLKQLPDKISKEKLGLIAAKIELNNIKNYKILRNWFPLVIDNLYKPAYDSAQKFLETCMDGSLIKIYRALAKTSEGMEIARRIYRETRPHYNRYNSAKIDVVLGWEE